MPLPQYPPRTDGVSSSRGGGGGDAKHPQRRSICFSFAAYAKSVMDHLGSMGVPISRGLSDLELIAIESAHRFHFPPDLKSILCEGVPVGPGFPDWRSPQQLIDLLLSLPVTAVLDELSTNTDPTQPWPESFGIRPSTAEERLSKATTLLLDNKVAPTLVPIYRNFYIPASSPSINGNPVFCVRPGFFRIAALDLADFFNRFRPHAANLLTKAPAHDHGLPTPAWAAKSARRVEVWTEVAGGGAEETGWMLMKEMGWRLREGGWGEEDVREMLLLGGDAADRMVIKDREGLMRHVRLLALALLRAGWSTEDVLYCMGSTQREGPDVPLSTLSTSLPSISTTTPTSAAAFIGGHTN